MTLSVLVIGGLGYIGSVLYEILEKEEWKVDILDNHLYTDLTPVNPFIVGDTRNRKFLEKILVAHKVQEIF